MGKRIHSHLHDLSNGSGVCRNVFFSDRQAFNREVDGMILLSFWEIVLCGFILVLWGVFIHDLFDEY